MNNLIDDSGLNKNLSVQMGVNPNVKAYLELCIKSINILHDDVSKLNCELNNLKIKLDNQHKPVKGKK